MEITNEELVAQYLQGDELAFKEITNRTLGNVYSFALRFTGNESDAQDIAQETFVKAWRHLASYRPETSKFSTWLMRIAHNTAIDYLRKKKQVPFSSFDVEEKNVLAETVPDPALLAEEALIQAEDAQTLQAAIQQLPAPQREVLLLHYTNHLTFEEIGTLLHASINTVKSRHFRALITLRKLLSQQHEGGSL